MRSAFLAVLVAALLAPTSAAAQSAPFAPLPPAPQQQQPETTVIGGPDDGDGISGTQQALLIAAGILFVLGIGFAIARDARRNAPGEERAARPLDTGRPDESPGERKKRDARAVEKQKAAAKRARQARKKNRPVRK